MGEEKTLNTTERNMSSFNQASAHLLFSDIDTEQTVMDEDAVNLLYFSFFCIFLFYIPFVVADSASFLKISIIIKKKINVTAKVNV